MWLSWYGSTRFRTSTSPDPGAHLAGASLTSKSASVGGALDVVPDGDVPFARSDDQSDRYFPDGIDIYFENVGGEMMEAALANMNTYGRVAVRDVISEYTGAGRRAGVLRLGKFLARFGEFIAVISDWIRQGKVQVVEDVSSGLESVPSAFAALFRGKNIGKTLVKLA
ncbi:NADPH-dependent oxidoreductase 2-alkenal reductase-like [Phragmites australis]|uniref:NADPH-dependent oxidoreductase 2-alkenal reductase-like n=1 Tax=Phragmites australis TaxID=29695 RepID=UPI002D76A39E|nr:NADPH-dependent oxidoreductase 2-alkenal reductase-like [Phragmites australis]